MTCPQCGKTHFVEVDRETDVRGKTYVLLECAGCKRCVILPEPEAKKAAG
jgi:predicted nucleic-acid-binding Zn-ribbon protein